MAPTIPSSDPTRSRGRTALGGPDLPLPAADDYWRTRFRELDATIRTVCEAVGALTYLTRQSAGPDRLGRVAEQVAVLRTALGLEQAL